MVKNKKRILFIILSALVLLCIPFAKAYAASKLSLYNYSTKKNIEYTGKQVKYYYNGKAINLKNTPGVIIDGVSLASFKDVFVSSGIKATYKYDAAKGKVTLTKGGTSIVLTVGNKTAYVNGKAVKMSLAPVRMKYKAQKTSKILVPARFVAEQLGYKYVWNSASSTSSITKPKNLFFNNKQVAYTSTLGQVTVDGEQLNLGYMPSIIVDNTAMVRAKKVFSDSSIGAKYSYNVDSGEITLTKGNIEVKLTLGESIAYVNGKARVMDTAPIEVENLDVGYTYVMVPGSFVASYLGYDYQWDSISKKSIITSRADNGNEDYQEDEIDGPELGGEETPKPETTFFQWDIQNEYLDGYTNISNISNTTEISMDNPASAYVYAVNKAYLGDMNKETYTIHSTTPINKTSVSLKDQILTLHMNNSIAGFSNSYFSDNFVYMVAANNNASDLSSDINFNLMNPNIKYELTLSEDKCILYVTLYKGYLNNVTAGSKGNSDYVLLTSTNELKVELLENDNFLTLLLPNTVNGVGNKGQLTGSTNSLLSVQSSMYDSNKAQILLEKSPTSTYTVTQTGNTYMISFDEGKQTDEGNQSVETGYDLTINLPKDISYSEVKHEDQYYNNKFIITLPGDYLSFYYENPLYTSNNNVSDITVRLNNHYDTEIVVSTSKLQGYKLHEEAGYIGVEIGNPRDIYQNIVVLDAGHGGTDPGAMRDLNGVTYKEKDINFSIIYERAKKYFDSDDSNIKVYYSRYNDTKVDLYKRAAFAKEVGADLFISLHMNANNKTSVKGTEIYYSDSNNAITKNGLSSKGLANIFLNYLPKDIGTVKRDIRAQKYVVVHYNTVPAILIEVGFMSNKDDLSLMAQDSFRENTAKSIYDILNLVFDAYPTGR